MPGVNFLSYPPHTRVQGIPIHKKQNKVHKEDTLRMTNTEPLQKGGVPAAPSGTATLLRLSPNHQFYPRALLDGHALQVPPAFMA